MSFALVTTQHFERRARKFLRKHPDLRQALRDTLDDLNRDPFQPKLKLRSLSGNLGGAQAVSFTRRTEGDHVAQHRNAIGLHLLYHLRPVGLDRARADLEFARDVLVR